MFDFILEGGVKLRVEETSKRISKLTYGTGFRLLLNLYSIVPTEGIKSIKMSLENTSILVDAETEENSPRYLEIISKDFDKKVYVHKALSCITKKDELTENIRSVLPEFEVLYK